MESIIGDDIEDVLQRFLTAIPNRLSVGRGRSVFNAVIVMIDDRSGKATSIERISREVS